MTAKIEIDFNDPLEHSFDPTKLELANDRGQIKRAITLNELFFFNFDLDGDEVSKRGNTPIVLAGSSDITGGKLNLNENDGARASIVDILDGGLATKFSFRFKTYVNFATLVVDTDLLTLKSKIDLSQVRYYFSNQGGGITRLNLEIKNNLGNIVHSSVNKLFTFMVGDVFQIGFAKDGTSTKASIDGVGADTPVAFPADMSDCDIFFGDSGNTNWSYDDFQFFNDKQDFLTGSIVPEPVTYPLGENAMVTTIPFLMDEIKDFDIVAAIPVGSQLKHIMILENSKIWHDTNNWVPSNGSLAQANTKAEILANLATLPLIKGFGVMVQFCHVFESVDGYVTPRLELLKLAYTHSFGLTAIVKCLVKGEVLDNCGCPVVGAKISVDSEDYLHTDSFVGPKCVAETGTDGKWAVNMIETTTSGTKVNVTISYPSGEGFDEEKEYPELIIPNISTEKFNKIVLDSAA